MRILITGIAGLVGSNFANHLIHRGYEVFGVDNLSGGYIENVSSKASFHLIDICDKNVVNKFFDTYYFDYVYHFAAYAAEGLSPFIKNYNYTNNVIGAMNIINGCVNTDVRKLIFTSSMAVYGNNSVPFTEDQIPSPEDSYGIAKYTVEQDIIQTSKQFGLKYNIVRPHNIIGPNQNIWDRYRNVIGIWIYQSMKNGVIKIFGDGEQTRAFSDINYYMVPLELLTKGHNNETYNLGADKFYTIKEAAETVKKIAEKLGYKPKIEYVESRNEVKHAYCDHSKAKKDLEFSDYTNLEEVVAQMFYWAKKQPYYMEREVKNMPYEIEKNIYTYWK